MLQLNLNFLIFFFKRVLFTFFKYMSGSLISQCTNSSLEFTLLGCCLIPFLAVKGATPHGHTLPENGMTSQDDAMMNYCERLPYFQTRTSPPPCRAASCSFQLSSGSLQYLSGVDAMDWAESCCPELSWCFLRKELPFEPST